MFKNFKIHFSLILLCIVIGGCTDTANTTSVLVTNTKELTQAIKDCVAGDEIVLKNGVWNNVQIDFYGEGTEQKPIILRAETAGKVSIEGESFINLGGSYLEVRDLYFNNGHTPTKTLIRFKINDEKIANHCKFINNAIVEFTQPDRDDTDHWIELWGRHNTVSNNYISGKSNFGPTVMVMLKGNQHIKNYHQIVNNHFGPRPRKGGPHGETMQIGDSGTSMTPSHTNVANNLFERCNGEVEIISSKSNNNVFENNVFFESEGSLVLRHGNYATINRNIFIGNDNSPFIGGIRVINTGHWITNNYFYKLKGETFRAPLAVMNGIPKSPLNRYNQVTDAVIAHNTFIKTETPFHFSVGSNVSQSAVLPKSEIRSARPLRTTVANNFMYKVSTSDLIKAYDTIDGVNFKNNVVAIENQKVKMPDGFLQSKVRVVKKGNFLYVPTETDRNIFNGFDFETIDKDLFGNSRDENSTVVGAIVGNVKEETSLFNKKEYGTNWFDADGEKTIGKSITINTSKELRDQLVKANSGDTLLLASKAYEISDELKINKDVLITTKDKLQPATLNFSSKATAFRMQPKGYLRLRNVILKGTTTQNTFTTLNNNMSQAYSLWLDNVEISNFKSVLEVSKGSFADTVSVKNSKISNVEKGFQLNKETNDKGDYNSAFVIIENSEFQNIEATILDYYRGGYDESTIGGHLTFANNTVSNSGTKEPDNILIKNRGIVNLTLADNTFKNNPVNTIAVLWGEKGQRPVNNTISNSGEIKTVQNLKLKLMY